MRKRMTHLAGMAVTALLALTACNEEAALTQPAEPQMPPVAADNSGNVYITGDDFTWELGGGGGDASSIAAVTRSQLTIDGNTARFTWTPGDRVGILPDEGAQVWFEIPTPEEGEEPTNVATFDGGAWALKPTSDYAAYYPFVKDFDLDRTAVPVLYTGQVQTGNGSTAHLGAYDYQGARPSTTNASGGVTLDFDHVGALVLLQFTVPTSGTQLTGVTLSADGAAFTTAGTYDLTSTEGFPITPTATAESFTIGLDHTTTMANEAVTLYFLCAPIDLSGKTVSVSVAYGTEGKTYNLMAEGKNLQAAGGYLMEAGEKEEVDLSTLTGTYVINDNAYYTFTGTGNYGIKVESGNPRIILNNTSITVGKGSSAIDIASGSNATIFVMGNNTVDTDSELGRAGGIFVAEGGTVNITSNSNANILRAHGSHASAIGGKYDYDNSESYNAGSINISNVTVYAYTNNFYASAIGAAGEGTCGTINITNAVIYAYGAGDKWSSAPGIGSAWGLEDRPETIPVVIISESEIHTFRYNSYSDYIGYLGDENGEEGGFHATGSINCGEGGSIANSTIYCYTGLDATTTDKVVTYDADGNPTEN